MNNAHNSQISNLEQFVEAFEDAQVRYGVARLEEFLPSHDHQQYKEIVLELIRVDLEYGWSHRKPRPLDEYLSQFPELFIEISNLQLLAFEEFRLRRQSGEQITPDDYHDRYSINTTDWPVLPIGQKSSFHSKSAKTSDPDSQIPEFSLGKNDFDSFSKFDPQTANRLHEILASLPGDGERFLDFEIVEKIGRGAFGQVYLARQKALADRLVVLKITSKCFSEPDRLAQLQHTNIVPVYSVHRVGELQAICMPYFGSTTLADIISTLNGRKNFPSTGKELLSTVAAWKHSTLKMRSLSNSRGIDSKFAEVEKTPELQIVENRELFENYSYHDFMLWIAERLAEGLAHAHRRGIVHRDIKPANILLTDDGNPMLLDFNLSAQVAPLGPSSTLIGGTLPYMSPEHIKAVCDFGQIDERSDIYSLGVILFELLTGQHPFPLRTGSFERITEEMISDRETIVPSLRTINPHVTADIESIVLKCLDPSPKSRYQNAIEFGEDLQLQLDSKPLRHAPNRSISERAKKWNRRHPRVTSASGVTLISLALVCLFSFFWIMRGRRIDRLQAHETYNEFYAELPDVRASIFSSTFDRSLRESGVEHAKEFLAKYSDGNSHSQEIENFYNFLSEEDRQLLRVDLAEIQFLTANSLLEKIEREISHNPENKAQKYKSILELTNSAIENFGDDVPNAMLLRKAEILQILGRTKDANALKKISKKTNSKSLLAKRLQGFDLAIHGHFRKAVPYLEESTTLDPTNFSSWFVLGNCYAGIGRFDAAENCFTTCIALWPNSFRVFFHRGLSRLERNNFDGAIRDFDRVLKIRPTMNSAFVNRALSYMGLKKFDLAIADITHAIANDAPQTRLYFIRSRLYRLKGDSQRAMKDFEIGLKREPNDIQSWIARGIARLPKNPKMALDDFRSALKIDTKSHEALRNIAHVQSEYLKKPDEAIATLDKLISMTKDDPAAWAGRGVLQARNKQRKQALKDAQHALAIRRDSMTVYQVACIYALTSATEPKDADLALKLLAEAFPQNSQLLPLARTDHDLDPLRKLPKFRNLVMAVRVLQSLGL